MTRIITVGTAGDDILVTTEADDLINALGGHDVVEAGGGADEVLGGEGDDRLAGGSGADLLYGEAGDDTLEGGTGVNALSGGTGNDVLIAGDEGDELDGGSGNDRLVGGAGGDSIDTGDGNDVVRAGAGNDTVFGGEGDHDIETGDGDDRVFLDEGRSRVDLGAGNDTLYGDDGEDTVLAGSGNDYVDGYDGNDRLDGGAGDDVLDGGYGDDVLVDLEGDNELDGDVGNDRITAGGGNDTIDGDDGDDVIDAGAGTNVVDAGSGNDVVTTGGGNDAVDGDDGDDVIDAGAGDDRLDGGRGSDVLTGGAGADTFILGFDARPTDTRGYGIGALAVDTITDFDAARDKLDLAGLGDGLLESAVNYTEASRWRSYYDNATGADLGRAYAADLFKQGVARFAQDGADTVIQLDTSVTGGLGGWQTLVRLENVALSSLSQANIVQPVNGDRPTADFLGQMGRQGTDGAEAMTAGAAGETLYAGDGNDVLTGGAGADVLVGGAGDDAVSGGAGADTVRGDAGDDLISGGAGKDLLVGGEGNDTYAFNLGDGVDMIADGAGGNDVLRFGAGITREQVQVIQSGFGDDIVIVVATSSTQTDRVVLENGGGIERIEFANGGVITRAELVAMSQAGGWGYDVIYGTSGADTLRGGPEDRLVGRGGEDTYRYELGDGRVTVDDAGLPGERGTLRLGAGIFAAKLRVDQDGSDLVVLVEGSSYDGVVLSGVLDEYEGGVGDKGGLDKVTLADDTVLTLQQVFDLSLTGAGGRDIIQGDARDNTLEGNGSADVLAGGAGSDTYIYARGDGFDQIRDSSDLDDDNVPLPGATDVDTLRFEAGITAADVHVLDYYGEEFTLFVGGHDSGDRIDAIGLDRVVFASDPTTVWTLDDLRRLANTPTDFADELRGTAGNDTVNALKGDDRLYAAAGDDEADGGEGADRLYGGEGNDRLKGGDGDDLLVGNQGDDVIEGGAGNDTLRGDEDEWGRPEAGNDILRGGEGDDRILAGAGDDVIEGGAGNDVLVIEAARAAFEVTRVRDTLTLRDLRDIDGTDTVTGVEILEFTDAILTVDGFNDKPVLVEDRFETKEDTALTFTVADLLANDSDPNRDDLTVVGVTLLAGGVLAFDRDSGTITFTPDGPYPQFGFPSFTGTVEITYTVIDSRGAMQTRQSFIEVTPVNDAPVIDPSVGQNWVSQEDVPYTSTGTSVVRAASDEDDAVLTYHVVEGSVGGGSVVLDPESRAWTFTPAEGFSGRASFRYRAFDGELYSNERTVTVHFEPVNDAPLVARGVADVDGLEDRAVDVTLATDAFRDPDGDALAYTAALANGAALPSWLAFDAATRRFTGTPPQDFNGALDITVTAADPAGLQASDTFRLTLAAVNDGPTARADQASGTEDQPLRIKLADLLGNDVDADGDALAVTAVGGAVKGTVALDAARGEVVFTGERDHNGAASFTYTVSDGQGGTATATVAVSVAAVNDAPVAATGPESARGQEDAPLRGRVLAGSDPDGDALTYRLVAGSATNGTVSLDADGAFTFTGTRDFNGAAEFRYQALDGQGGVSAEKRVAITLDAVNDAPVAVADAGFETEAGKAVTIKAATLLANDTDPDGHALTLLSVDAGTGGSAALAANGDVVFTPTAGFTGAASFTYAVSDGNGGAASATVALTVRPGTVEPPPTGAQVINGTDGSNLLSGTDKAEVINAKGGNDLVFAGGGNDDLRGGEGWDALFAGSGNDLVFGDGGNDALFGEAGNDRLNGGRGIDALTGGAGQDTFVFDRAFGSDTVLDFQAGPGAGDVLDIAALSLDTFGAVKAAAKEAAVLGVVNTVIDAGVDGRIVLVNVRLASLAADDFYFG